MDKQILLVALISLVSVITILPIMLMLFNRGTLQRLNRLANLNQIRANANQPNDQLRRLSMGSGLNVSQLAPLQNHNINTRTTTIWTAVFIAFSTLVSLVAFYFTHRIVDKEVKPFVVNWLKSDTLNLKSGPTWFYYDTKQGKLNTAHSINETEKVQLNGLLNNNDKMYQSYCRAIDELAYKSNLQHNNNALFGWFALLYAIAGLIGVQLRTINNFIGITCFKNEFNFHRWWPWYLARPLLGFITGAAVFLLIDGKQLLAGQLSSGVSSAALVVAFLGGFSTDEFYEQLRKISKRIFGVRP